jgi:SAM-dependent methyltransferase
VEQAAGGRAAEPGRRGASDVPPTGELSSPQREQQFWDEHVPSLQACLAEFHRGPDPNTRAMLDAVAPLSGRRVLDFACGAGVTTAWLAARGGIVTGIDVSPASIARAREVAHELGLRIDFKAGELRADTYPRGSFDAIVGRYALHHVDIPSIATAIATVLTPGGNGAFVETMALNPVLNLARRGLVGRAGVAKLGSDDEHPLTKADLAVLAAEIGSVSLHVENLTFMRIFDRNVLGYRWPPVSRMMGKIDDALLSAGLGRLSFHQVVKVTNSPAAQ